METNTEKKVLDNYRFERKYILNQNQLFDFYFYLSKNGFYKKYDVRKVHSIYFDSANLLSKDENKSGLYNRKKVRYRYYDDEYNNGVIELKIKKGFLGTKKYYDFNNKDLKNFDLKNLLHHLDLEINNNIIHNEQISHHLFPILYLHYFRDYYVSHNNKFRITIDKNIFYKNLINENSFRENDIVVEIKYDSKNVDKSEIFSLPFLKYTRNSKYVNGIDKTTLSQIFNE